MNWKVLDYDVGGCTAYVPKKKCWISAAIGAAGALLGSALQNSSNASMDKETREWQEYMYDKNNNYNTPANQRRRLEDAGINPALAFQSGNTGVAASSPSAVQHTPADYSALGSGLSASAQLLLAERSTDAQNELTRSQTEAQRISNVTLYAEHLVGLYKALNEAEKSGADTEFIRWQINRGKALLDSELDRNYAEIENLSSQSQLSKVQAKQQEILNQFTAKQQRLILNNLAKQGSEIDSRIRLNDRQGALAAANEALSQAQKEGVVIDNKTKKNMSEFIVDEAYYKAESERWKGSNERKQFYGGAASNVPAIPGTPSGTPVEKRKHKTGGIR